MVDADAKSFNWLALVRLRARWAHAELCHASSFSYFLVIFHLQCICTEAPGGFAPNLALA